MNAKDFPVGLQSHAYTNPARTGFLRVECLHFLKGRQWDDIALAYVHSLRPSSVRVTRGGMHCDARPWRVTVFVDDSGCITKVSQEAEVGLPDGVEHGHNLECIRLGKAPLPAAVNGVIMLEGLVTRPLS